MPSVLQPRGEASTLRGLTEDTFPASTTLPGGRIETIVMAGAGVLGGVGVLPVPVSGKLSGLLDALLITVTLADLLPVVAGENTTFQVQVASDASVAPQVLVLIENSEAFVPVSAMLVIVTDAPPMLRNVTAVGE